MTQYTMKLIEVMELVDIFDFKYPFYKEEYRKEFEDNFINNFLLDEIAHETIQQFKHRLKVKLNTIMPFYNKIFETQEMKQRILDNYDVTEEFTRDLTNKSKDVNTTSNNITTNGVNKNLYKDAPKTRIDINNFDVVTNLSKDINENVTTSSTTINNLGDNDQNEKWKRTMKGNIGIQTDADAIVKYWESIRKVEEEIFEECKDLFMGVF